MQLENSLLKLAPNRVFQYLLIYLFLILFAGITFMHLMRPVVKNKKRNYQMRKLEMWEILKRSKNLQVRDVEPTIAPLQLP